MLETELAETDLLAVPCVYGRILKLLNIVDEHTREELGGLVERRINADRTVAALESIVTRRGAAPSFISFTSKEEQNRGKVGGGAPSGGQLSIGPAISPVVTFDLMRSTEEASKQST